MSDITWTVNLHDLPISHRNPWIMQTLKWMRIKISINYWIYILHQQHSGCDRSFLDKQTKWHYKKSEALTWNMTSYNMTFYNTWHSSIKQLEKAWRLTATTAWSNLGLENCVSLVNFQFFTVSKRLILIDRILIKAFWKTNAKFFSRALR